MTNITILGAGITGVSLGSFLSDKKYNIEVLEKNSAVGGLAGSFKYKEYTLDYGPHKIYSQIDNIIPEFEKIAKPDKLLKIEKKNSLRLLGKYFDFPAKIPQIILGISPIKSASLGAGFAISTAKGILSKKQNKNYEEYFISGFGKPAYNLLFKDYATKVWGEKPQNLSEELARKRVPVPNVIGMLLGDKGKSADGKEISAKHFWYPKYGGLGFISEKYSAKIKKNGGKVLLNAKPSKVNVEGKKVVSVEYKTMKDGKETGEKQIVPTDFLASTIYLKDFVELFPNAPKKVKESAGALKYRSMVIVYLIVKKPRAMKDNWVFFPEKRYIFNRIAELNSFSPFITKKGYSVLTAEITCNFQDEIYNGDEQYLFRRVMDDLEDAGLLEEKDVVEHFTKKSGRVYPVYDINYKKNLSNVLEFLDQFENVITLGRQGLYNYNNTDHCIDMSLKATEYITEKLEDPNHTTIYAWQRMREYFDSYKIVD